MLYEVTGAPVVIPGGGSQRVALPALVSHGALRLTVEGHGFFAFGDNTVVASSTADSAGIVSPSSTGGVVEFIVPPADATHIAVLRSSGNVTITPVRILG